MAITSLYEILEVSPRASPAVIRAAYRCLAQRHHPDKNPHSAEAGPRLAMINLAYAVLSDVHQRRAYDTQGGRYTRVVERRGHGEAPRRYGAPPHADPSPCRPFVFRPLMQR
jgi:molecular chaperone DnaJ